VWPAMERKTSFDKSEVTYLANLCHDCRDCYYACPYIPPHEFNINIPKVLSEVRLKSYEENTQPKFLSKIFEVQQRFSTIATLLSILLTFSVALLVSGEPAFVAPHVEPGSFYDIFPYLLIIVAGAIVGAYVVALFVKGVISYCVSLRGSFRHFLNFRANLLAMEDSLGHRWFRGGGAGCTHQSSEPSHSFLLQHALIIYGFLSALASTISAGISQDVFGLMPPYPLLSVPVILATSGGLALIVGVGTTLYQKRRTVKESSFEGMTRLDYSFLSILGLVALTGMLTLVLRDTAYMGTIFALHLGLVLSLFITAPYGKFVHFLYRYISLVNNRLDELTASPA